jgi:hypothetical protein
MNKLITGMLLFYLVNLLLGGFMEGTGDIASTKLTANLTAVGTTITVANTSGFLQSDVVIIGSERIRYVNKTATTLIASATGRGYSGTTAKAYSTCQSVYSQQASVINNICGFNVAATGSTVGDFNIATALPQFLTITAPKLITWDFPQFRNEAMLYFRIILAINGGCLLLYLAFQVGSLVAQSIISRI